MQGHLGKPDTLLGVRRARHHGKIGGHLDKDLVYGQALLWSAGLISRLLSNVQDFPTIDFHLEAMGIIKQGSQDVFILKE